MNFSHSPNLLLYWLPWLFGSKVKIELPLTNMDATGKASAERAITAVKERGHTNLSGGLLQGLQVITVVPQSTRTMLERWCICKA